MLGKNAVCGIPWGGSVDLWRKRVQSVEGRK